MTGHGFRCYTRRMVQAAYYPSPLTPIFLSIYLSIYLRLSSELALISMESGQAESCCVCIVL